MADGQGGMAPPDPQAQARDWITIWHSELAAMATDRELQEAWLRWVALCAEAAASAARFLPGSLDHAAGRTGAAAPAGSPSIVAAPDARDAAIERLAQRVAELERRLAGLAAAAGDDQRRTDP